MKHALAVVALMLTSGLAASCSGSDDTMSLLGGDGGDDGATNCGGSGKPCCNGAACNAGLTCHSGSCSAPIETDATVTTDAAVAPDAGEDAAHDSGADSGGDATVDAGGDSGDGAALDATVTDAGNQDAATADATSDVDATDASPVVDAGSAADSCVNACVLGATECLSNGISTCVANPGGCLVWGPSVTCGVRQSCSTESDGGATCTCLAEAPCTQTGPACENSTTIATCAADSDGCFFVSATKGCDPSDEECTGSPGAAACTCVADTACSTASPYCSSGSTVVTCVADSNGCPVHTTKTCAAHEACSGAAGAAMCACNNDPTCTQAGNVCVSPTAIEVCSADSNGCLFVSSAPTACTTSVSNATADCSGNACGFTCVSGYSPCAGACVNEQTDNFNCGGCAVTCAGTCTGGRCLVTLASGQRDPYAIAVDSANVYWGNYTSTGTTGTVMKCSVGGCGSTPTTLYVSPQGATSALAVDGTNVYWTNNNYHAGGPNLDTVMMIPVDGQPDGGAPATLAPGQNGLYASQIAVDGKNVYWANNSNTLQACAISGCGGSPTPLSTALNYPLGIGVTGGNVFLANQQDILECATGGCAAPTPFDSGSSATVGIGVDSVAVYWTTTAGAVMSRSLASGTLATLAASTPGNTGAVVGTPFDIALDDANVYWFTPSPDANGTNESIMKTAKGGGTAVPLLANQSLLQGIAVDSTSVYWTTGNGNVMKLTPK